MADRTNASIEIGGNLATHLISDLIMAAQCDGCCRGWDDEALDESMVKSGETLEVFATELAWGHFEALEQFCMDNGLSYRLRAGGCSGSFGPERAIYDGKGGTRTFAETECGQVVISLDEVRKLGTIEAIEHWFAEAEADTPPLILTNEGEEREKLDRAQTSA